MKRTYNSKEAGELIGVSRPTIEKYAKTGRLRAWKVGREWRFDGPSVRAEVEYRSTGVRPVPPC